jgi:hypothetical protein
VYKTTATATSDYRFSKNIIRGTGSNTKVNGIDIDGSNSNITAKSWNNIIFGSGTGVAINAVRGTNTLYNNTVALCTNCITSGGSSTTVAKNNIADSCTTSCYAGTFAGGSNYNTSKMGTATGGANDTVLGASYFRNPAGGDYRIDPMDLPNRAKGINLSGEDVTDDIEGLTRVQWSRGASDIVFGPNSYSVDLDGIDDQLVASYASIHLTPSQSLSFWIKYKGDAGTLISNEDGTDRIDIVNATTIQAVGSYTENYTVNLVNGNWYHLVFVNQSSTLSLYVNGALVGANPAGQQTYLKYFGVRGTSGTPNPLSVTIADVASWYTALPANAVTALYNSGVPLSNLTMNSGNYTQSTSLGSWWLMGDGLEKATGSYIVDMNSSGNGMMMINMDYATDYVQGGP